MPGHGSGCLDTCCRDLGSCWRWVVSFIACPLYLPVKSPKYPLDGRLGEPQNWSGWREISWVYRDSNSVFSGAQSVAYRYTICALVVPRFHKRCWIYCLASASSRTTVLQEVGWNSSRGLELIWKVSVKIKPSCFLWLIKDLYLYIKIILSETITRS